MSLSKNRLVVIILTLISLLVYSFLGAFHVGAGAQEEVGLGEPLIDVPEEIRLQNHPEYDRETGTLMPGKSDLMNQDTWYFEDFREGCRDNGNGTFMKWLIPTM